MSNSQAPMQAVEVRVYPIFTIRWLAVHALAIPSVFLALLLGRLVAIEIYAAKFPDSPTVKALRVNPLMSLKSN